MPNKRPLKIGEIAEPQIFQVGDRVTVRSILCKSQLLGKPTSSQLANYPSLIGVALTISEITEDWIVCTRASGTTTPGLTSADLEFLEVRDEI
jgi:hypothetical protein